VNILVRLQIIEGLQQEYITLVVHGKLHDKIAPGKILDNGGKFLMLACYSHEIISCETSIVVGLLSFITQKNMIILSIKSSGFAVGFRNWDSIQIV